MYYLSNDKIHITEVTINLQFIDLFLNVIGQKKAVT